MNVVHRLAQSALKCLPGVAHDLWLMLLLLSAMGFAPMAHAQRVALLIGNSSYQAAPLRNPPNDVREMESALTAIGFKVQKVLNANQNQMKRAVRDFGALAQGAEVAFLYYSGHGTQASGENYLLPIGATIDKEADYEVEAVSANALMRQIAGARPKAAIVVLDACRDNPYASAAKSTSKGLTRMDAPTGTMIAFATSPNNTASDEGHYARALAARLKTPGAELIDVFRDTTSDVRRLTQGKQEPRISEMSISDRIYLAGPPQGLGSTPPVQVASIRPEPVVIPPQQPEPARPAPSTSGQTIKDCTDCPQMVVIPAGSFQMGSTTGDADEKPVHNVNVKGFALGKYEVTRGQFAAFVAASGHNAGNSCYVLTGDKWADTPDRNWRNPGSAQTDNDPVACVNWEDVQAYVRWLTQKTGQTYRLPSEAEWEYACRGGANQTYCGSDSVDSVAVYGRKSGDKTQPVGGKQANAWGLHDMSGNVCEWTQDCWNDNYSGAPSDGNAWTTGTCGQRVVRGGSWSSFASNTRAASRNRVDAAYRDSDGLGFRLARMLL
jgi:formylglycine-generating enzyme required for sulfatase activity